MSVDLPPSFWRCDPDGESFAFRVSVISATSMDGEEMDVPEGFDATIESLGCPICGGPMRRIVSLLDLRDWSAQFA